MAKRIIKNEIYNAFKASMDAVDGEGNYANSFNYIEPEKLDDIDSFASEYFPVYYIQQVPQLNFTPMINSAFSVGKSNNMSPNDGIFIEVNAFCIRESDLDSTRQKLNAIEWDIIYAIMNRSTGVRSRVSIEGFNVNPYMSDRFDNVDDNKYSSLHILFAVNYDFFIDDLMI